LKEELFKKWLIKKCGIQLIVSEIIVRTLLVVTRKDDETAP